MAIMQEDILKFGVRTRKRNKSIKESAKLALESMPMIPIHVAEIKKLIVKDQISADTNLNEDHLLNVLISNSCGRNPTFFKAFGHNEVFGLKNSIPDGGTTVEIVEKVPVEGGIGSVEDIQYKKEGVLYVHLPDGHPVITGSAPSDDEPSRIPKLPFRPKPGPSRNEGKLEQKRDKLGLVNKEMEVIKSDTNPSTKTLIQQEKNNGENSSLSSQTGGEKDSPKKSNIHGTGSKLKNNEIKPATVTIEEDLEGKSLTRHRHNLRPQRSSRHFHALKQQAKRRQKNKNIAAGIALPQRTLSRRSTLSSTGEIEIPFQPYPEELEKNPQTMKEVLNSIPGFNLRKLKLKGQNKKFTNAQMIQQTKEGSINLDTPDSILSQVNLRTLLNKTTFSRLPPLYQFKLMQLLPQVDLLFEDSKGLRLNSTAFNNEFFAKACQDWRERLSRGDFTTEALQKGRSDLEKDRQRLDPWKAKHYEPLWGMKRVYDLNKVVPIGLETITSTEEPDESACSSPQTLDTKGGNSESESHTEILKSDTPKSKKFKSESPINKDSEEIVTTPSESPKRKTLHVSPTKSPRVTVTDTIDEIQDIYEPSNKRRKIEFLEDITEAPSLKDTLIKSFNDPILELDSKFDLSPEETLPENFLEPDDQNECEPILPNTLEKQAEVTENTEEQPDKGSESTEEQIKNIENEIALLKSDIEASEKQTALRATSPSDDSMDEYINSDDDDENKLETPIKSPEIPIKLPASPIVSENEDTNACDEFQSESIPGENLNIEESLQHTSFHELNLHDENSNKSDTFEGVKDKMIGNFQDQDTETDLKMLSENSSEEDSQPAPTLSSEEPMGSVDSNALSIEMAPPTLSPNYGSIDDPNDLSDDYDNDTMDNNDTKENNEIMEENYNMIENDVVVKDNADVIMNIGHNHGQEKEHVLETHDDQIMSDVETCPENIFDDTEVEDSNKEDDRDSDEDEEQQEDDVDSYDSKEESNGSQDYPREIDLDNPPTNTNSSEEIENSQSGIDPETNEKEENQDSTEHIATIPLLLTPTTHVFPFPSTIQLPTVPLPQEETLDSPQRSPIRSPPPCNPSENIQTIENQDSDLSNDLSLNDIDPSILPSNFTNLLSKKDNVRPTAITNKNRPPIGSVNLQRSYEICKAVVEKSANRAKVENQLVPPPAKQKKITHTILDSQTRMPVSLPPGATIVVASSSQQGKTLTFAPRLAVGQPIALRGLRPQLPGVPGLRVRLPPTAVPISPQQLFLPRTSIATLRPERQVQQSQLIPVTRLAALRPEPPVVTCLSVSTTCHQQPQSIMVKNSNPFTLTSNVITSSTSSTISENSPTTSVLKTMDSIPMSTSAPAVSVSSITAVSSNSCLLTNTSGPSLSGAAVTSLNAAHFSHLSTTNTLFSNSSNISNNAHNLEHLVSATTRECSQLQQPESSDGTNSDKPQQYIIRYHCLPAQIPGAPGSKHLFLQQFPDQPSSQTSLQVQNPPEQILPGRPLLTTQLLTRFPSAGQTILGPRSPIQLIRTSTPPPTSPKSPKPINPQIMIQQITKPCTPPPQQGQAPVYQTSQTSSASPVRHQIIYRQSRARPRFLVTSPQVPQPQSQVTITTLAYRPSLNYQRTPIMSPSSTTQGSQHVILKQQQDAEKMVFTKPLPPIQTTNIKTIMKTTLIPRSPVSDAQITSILQQMVPEPPSQLNINQEEKQKASAVAAYAASTFEPSKLLSPPPNPMTQLFPSPLSCPQPPSQIFSPPKSPIVSTPISLITTSPCPMQTLTTASSQRSPIIQPLEIHDNETDVLEDDSSLDNVTIPEIPEDLNGIDKEKETSETSNQNSRLILKLSDGTSLAKNQMNGRFVLVQNAEGQIIAIPTASLKQDVPPRASSAPPSAAERNDSDSLPTRPASVDTSPNGVKEALNKQDSFESSDMSEMGEIHNDDLRESDERTSVGYDEMVKDECDTKIDPKSCLAQHDEAKHHDFSKKLPTPNIKLKPKPNKGNKMMLKSYGVPLLPKPPSMIQNGVNSVACNMKAMVVCKNCGAFCHDDCISSSRLCVTCLIR